MAANESDPLLRAKIWYLFVGASGVFLSPYYNVYFLQRGLNETTIGTLSALRTWLPAIAAFMWSGVADKYGIHKLIVLVGFVVSTVLRTSLAFASTTVAFFLLVAASELVGAGVGPITDAAVVAACTEEGDYGKQRLWASLGWGGLSAVAGMVITNYGIRAGFIGYAALAVPCAITALGMGFNTKRPPNDPSSPRGAYQELPASPLGLRTRASSTLSCEISVAVPVEAVGLIAAFHLDDTDVPPPDAPQDACDCSAHAPAAAAAACPQPACSSDCCCVTIGTQHQSCFAPGGEEAAAAATAVPAPPVVSYNTPPPVSHHAPAGPVAGTLSRTRSFSTLPLAFPAETPVPTLVGIAPPQPTPVPNHTAYSTTPGSQATTTATAIGRPHGLGNTGNSASQHAPNPTPWHTAHPATIVGLQHPADGKPADTRPPPIHIHIDASTQHYRNHHANEAGHPPRDCDSPIPVITSLAASKGSKAWPRAAGQGRGRDEGPAFARVWATAADLKEAGVQVVAGRLRPKLEVKTGGGLVLAVGAGAEEAVAESVCGAEAADEGRESFWESMCVLLSCPQVLVFMLKTVVMGYALGIIGNYLFVYLQQLHGSATLMGLSLTVTCCSEVPAFWAQGWVLKRLRVTTIQHLVMACYTTRLILYSCLGVWGTPWAVLPVELLHGVTFGLAWGAGTVNCRRLAPPGLEATMQGLFSGLYYGVGQGLGGLVGGILMHRFGSASTFYYSAAAVVAGWALCTLLEGLIALRQWLTRRGGASMRPSGCAYEPVSGGEAGWE